MLLVCPSCRTRYVVPDAAIGANGRQVRCASCKHSWFQQGPEFDLATMEASAQPAASVAAEETRTMPEEPPAPPITPPRYGEDRPAERSQFAHEPPFRPRRNTARYWTMAAILFALLMAGAASAAWYYGLFEGGIAFAEAEPELEILLDKQQDRQTLTDGTEYFAASGTIINASAVEQRVPPLLVVLKDARGKKVFSWTMKPPVRSLPPGERIEFNEAKLDVPRAATSLTVGWAPRS